MRVISCCLTEKGAKELELAAKSNGPGAVQCVLMDVTKEDSVAKALVEIKKLVGADGGVHALINNAGVLRGELFDTMEMKEWDFQLAVNVVGAARVGKALLPLIVKARGRIINVASVAGIFGTEGTVAYNATKFAVVGMTDALRRELAPWGVTVSMVLPGIMNTPVSACVEEDRKKRVCVLACFVCVRARFTKCHCSVFSCGTSRWRRPTSIASGTVCRRSRKSSTAPRKSLSACTRFARESARGARRARR